MHTLTNSRIQRASDYEIWSDRASFKPETDSRLPANVSLHIYVFVCVCVSVRQYPCQAWESESQAHAANSPLALPRLKYPFSPCKWQGSARSHIADADAAGRKPPRRSLVARFCNQKRINLPSRWHLADKSLLDLPETISTMCIYHVHAVYLYPVDSS